MFHVTHWLSLDRMTFELEANYREAIGLLTLECLKNSELPLISLAPHQNNQISLLSQEKEQDSRILILVTGQSDTGKRLQN